MAASTPSTPSMSAAGTRVTFRDQNPTITINGKQYKIPQIQMRKAGETAWQKVDVTTVDLDELAKKCQTVFEDAKPTPEELSKLSFIFKKDDKPGTPLILREIKYLRNHASEMESFEVKVTLQSKLSHPFVDALFHPDKKGKVSPPPVKVPLASPVLPTSAKDPVRFFLDPDVVLVDTPPPPPPPTVEVID